MKPNWFTNLFARDKGSETVAAAVPLAQTPPEVTCPTVGYSAQMPSEAVHYFAEAKRAAANGDFDTAIIYLHAVLPNTQGEDSVEIKKSLTICLTNSAVQKTNRALESACSAVERKNRERWNELLFEGRNGPPNSDQQLS